MGFNEKLDCGSSVKSGLFNFGLTSKNQKNGNFQTNILCNKIAQNEIMPYSKVVA